MNYPDADPGRPKIKRNLQCGWCGTYRLGR